MSCPNATLRAGDRSWIEETEDRATSCARRIAGASYETRIDDWSGVCDVRRFAAKGAATRSTASVQMLATAPSGVA
jgi:hypothetical protein